MAAAPAELKPCVVKPLLLLKNPVKREGVLKAAAVRRRGFTARERRRMRGRWGRAILRGGGEDGYRDWRVHWNGK